MAQQLVITIEDEGNGNITAQFKPTVKEGTIAEKVFAEALNRGIQKICEMLVERAGQGLMLFADGIIEDMTGDSEEVRRIVRESVEAMQAARCLDTFGSEDGHAGGWVDGVPQPLCEGCGEAESKPGCLFCETCQKWRDFYDEKKKDNN